MTANKPIRILVFAFLVVMLSASASAVAEYVVTISPDYQNIGMDETAEYHVRIKNNMETEETFEIYSPDVEWDITPIPVSDKVVTIEPFTARNVRLQLKPLYVNPGRYGVKLNVRVSRRNMLISNYIMIGVNDPNPPPGEYLPAIRSDITMDKVVDPRENQTITIELENQNRRDISRVDIKLRSHVINTDYKTSLGPLEKKSIDIIMGIDPLVKPQEDVLRSLIFTTAGEKTYQFEATPFPFRIMHYGGLEEEITEKKSLMKTTKVVKLTNVGNGDIIDVYKIPKGFFEDIFTSSEPGSKKYRENGTRYIGWTVSLEPYETMTITVVENYRIPFGLLCAIVISAILYFLLRSPIIIHKSATVIATKEGGISELKILIVLKNRAGKELKDVSIIDKVPHIADVMKDFEMGTLHPKKVLKHEKKGTLIKWELDKLDKYEERVLAYKIRSRLSVLGHFRLPVVVAKFRSKAGNLRSTHSNSVTILSA